MGPIHVRASCSFFATMMGAASDARALTPDASIHKADHRGFFQRANQRIFQILIMSSCVASPFSVLSGAQHERPRHPSHHYRYRFFWWLRDWVCPQGAIINLRHVGRLLRGRGRRSARGSAFGATLRAGIAKAARKDPVLNRIMSHSVLTCARHGCSHMRKPARTITC